MPFRRLSEKMARLVRENTNPISVYSAMNWQRKLSYGYAILAWNIVGFLGYSVWKGSAWAKTEQSQEDHSLTESQKFVRRLNINAKEVKVLKISGTRVHSYEIDTAAESSKKLAAEQEASSNK